MSRKTTLDFCSSLLDLEDGLFPLGEQINEIALQAN